MGTFIMGIEYQEMSRLIAEASTKIELFEQKIRNISTAIDALKAKREPMQAVIDFSKREEKRNGLLGLFVKDGEYGLPSNFSADILKEIENRIDELSRAIDSYENKRKERIEGIEFIKADIELLHKIQNIDLRRDHYEIALIDS